MKDRPFHKNRFLAVCMGMVLAPRVASPASASSTTLFICSQSTPSWAQNCPSSDIMTAITTFLDMSSKAAHCLS
ncbi:hypothetical protein D3C87_2050250 [compost metagenome]